MRGNKFMFATGIENSYPTILLPDGSTKRVDEMEKTGHYQHWQTDFKLVQDSGIEFLRYGPPYYKTHTAPGVYDWDFTDDTFHALREMNITPIVDLCHFGIPDWIGDFQNPDFPHYFAEYAKAFAQRFPYLQLYTPVNEIFIAAMFSAQYGWWNERLQGDRHFVTALKHIAKANVMAMHAILSVQPEAAFIQSESSEYFHATDPLATPLARFLNQKRFLSLDLTYGYPLNVAMYEYLLSNGMSKAEYHWFLDNQIKARCIMGNDYYVTNEHIVHPDGTTQASGEIFGYYVITHQYYRRYRLPIMHTETNIRMPSCVEWLIKQWANVHRLKHDGIPVIGFTWYSLLHQVDWDSALRNDVGNINELGLYDLDRKIMPVGEAYRDLIRKWKDIISEESYGLIFHNW
ncbi:family 1 glycosylhydrolase [Sediminibacterium ginsengisoli]|uniref:Beta-glucosidase/6-phospho-beta-glucosidase/beta-galactosidase n=1 Tax=Sediminibacterium ginsengisoli TaxID=413434 RepID=A0A1T4Q317_9BACT|nr:family 1 glycosylhydrolase [Sediminibacterium ginsengisoli]SJZ98054.1 Beta-glucosidase/6-phospho-beta-glucosidase/beta-galactosidase [Sediminibacterium ginsengisoli]